MKIFTKILFFILILSACSSSRGGMTANDVYRVNHRAELQKLQRERQARVRAAKKDTEKAERQANKETKAARKQRAKEEKLRKKARKAGEQRHLDWQSVETRERMKANKQESEKNFTN
ncbi:MAG: hypothetical protein LBS12_03250 [Prevotellaceae bacterium]|jgi:hypothetical protein|nr:hypothetical protein [Prevotellaceae bacterium]